MFNKTKEFTTPEIKVNKKITNKSAYQNEVVHNDQPDSKKKEVTVDMNISNLTSDEVKYLQTLKDMMKNTSKSKIISQIKSMSESSLKISKKHLLKLLDSIE